jgi:hypothetical protein
MTDDRNTIIENPTFTVFDEAQFALEEAEFLTKTTKRAHSVVATATPDGKVFQYLVMERSRAMATAALVLETFRAMDDEPARGIN